MKGAGTAQRVAHETCRQKISQRAATSQPQMQCIYRPEADTRKRADHTCVLDTRSTKFRKDEEGKKVCVPRVRAATNARGNSSHRRTGAAAKPELDQQLKKMIMDNQRQCLATTFAMLVGCQLYVLQTTCKHEEQQSVLKAQHAVQLVELQEQLSASEASFKQRVESEFLSNVKLQEQLAAAVASEAAMKQRLMSLETELLNVQKMKEQLTAGTVSEAAVSPRVSCLESELPTVFAMQQAHDFEHRQQKSQAVHAMEVDSSSSNTTQARTNSVAHGMPMQTTRPAKRQRVEPPGQPGMSACRMPDLPDSCITHIASHLEGSSLLAFMATSRNMAKLTMDSLSMANKPLMTFKLSLNSRVEGFQQVMSWAHHIRLELEHVDCQTAINTAANSQYQARGVQEIRLRDESMVAALGTLSAFCPNAHTLDLQFVADDRHMDAIFNMPGLETLRAEGIAQLKKDYSCHPVSLRCLQICGDSVAFASFANLPLSGLSGPIEWNSPNDLQCVLLPSTCDPDPDILERAVKNLKSIPGHSSCPIKCNGPTMHFFTQVVGNARTAVERVRREKIARECWTQYEFKEWQCISKNGTADSYVVFAVDKSAIASNANISSLSPCIQSSHDPDANWHILDATAHYHELVQP